MRFKRRIIRNLNWNWAGTIGDATVAFLLCPLLLSHLGSSNYGAWVMIGSLAGYFGLLDFGIRGSVGRYVAFYRARDDREAVREIVWTAFGLLSVAAVVGCAATATTAFWARPLFGAELDAGMITQLRWAIVIAAGNLGLQLPLRVADGVLWGYERFDQLNATSIPADITRGALSAAVVFWGGGLIGLAVVGLTITILQGGIKALLALRNEPTLLLGARRFRSTRVREVLSFGFWNMLRSITTMVPVRITPLLVGALLGAAAVTPLSIAARLIATASAILVAATGVVVPIATAMHARRDHDAQRSLLREGGTYSLAAATVLLVLLLLLGRPLIHLWVGPDMDSAYPLLVVLAVGRWISMSQVVTRGMITAQARHRTLALVNLAQAVLTVVLIAALLRPWGVIGAVAAVALGDALCDGVFSMVFGCRLLGLPVARYVLTILAKTAAALALPCALLAAAIWWRPVTGWIELVAYGGVFSLLSVIACVGMNEGFVGLWPRRPRVDTEEQLSCAT